MRAPIGPLIAIAVHAAAIAWAERAIVIERDPRIASAPAAPPLEPEPLVATPIDVVFVDAVVGGHTAPAEHASRNAGTARAAIEARLHEPAPPDAGGEGAVTISPLLRMRVRGPAAREPMHGASGDFMADFLARSKPLAPPPDIPGERISDEIAALRGKLAHAERYGADEVGAMRAQIVALNEAKRREELRPAGGGTYRTEKETFRAHVAADGSVRLEDKPEAMDTQDRLMLQHGIDPYARNKLAYLDRTRDQRVAIGRRHRTQQLARATELARGNVERLWATTRDLRARKQGLFELWDECTETGDPEEVAAGTSARKYILGVIRARLTGANAYTADELAALNAHRRSTEAFAP